MKTIILTIAILISHSIISQEVIITSKKKDEIKTYIKHFEDNNQVMGTVSIFEDEKEVINETIGEKNKTTNNDEELKYTIGSISKMFVAVLFAKLQEEQKIRFEEKLSNYFPVVPNADKIEIRQLLNHTSGLKNYVSKNDSLHYWLKEPRTKQEIMEEIIDQGIEFQPGESMKYSNSAYYLLARILEIKHQKPLDQIIVDEITIPLQLKNTYGIEKNKQYNNIAKSYEKKKGQWVEMEEFYFPNVSGTGNIISTAFDLNIFLNALFSNKIIKDESLKSMLPKEDDWFGSGIMKLPFYDYIGYGHGGDTYGTHSVATYTKKNKIAITYIINGENYPTNDFAIGLLSILYDKEYALPEFKEYVPEKRYFELYEGKYGSEGFPISITIYEEEGELKAQGEGQPSFTLSPVERHVFEFKKADLKIEFKPEENSMNFEQAAHSFELKKT
jgi:D-alanyl-D-alanine carboxypeptidase